MTANYSSLSRAQLSFEYLHTNSTTHEFLFGALAELLDNSRDATATRMDIFSEPDETLRGGYMLFFVDDGEGMDPSETADIITFGRSTKRSLDMSHIGMYGNGLKSGSMRIGNDLMLFTKKGAFMTCLFLSRTFHEEEKIEEVIVPIPSFETNSRRPIVKGAKETQKHNTEMDIIYKYSPFKNEDEFFSQFDKIEGNTGTVVIVYNMKLLDSGDPELDILSDPTDILLANPESDFDSDEGLMMEKKSFRAYTSILYVDPRMKIYIQGKKVRTKKLASCLYKPKCYKYMSNRFKTRSENEAQRAKEEAKQAEQKAKEAESKAKHIESKQGEKITKDQRTELRKAQENAAECRRESMLKKQVAERKNKALKDPKLLNFIFGINLDHRAHDGVFVYNCGRLIKMFEKVGPQTEGGVMCSGVVGIVDIPYLVLEPTHNKQDFADAKEYRHLLKAMGEHMVQYWKDAGIAQQGVVKFWESFGYISQSWRDPPSDDSKYLRKRAMQINITLQCDNCLKWRTLPFSSNNIGKDFPDDWVCSMNPDVQHNKCSAVEQKMNIPEGVLKKEVKSKEQKQKDLEEEIRKKQEQLEKMNKTRTITSARQLAEMERKKKEEEERLRKEEEERRKEEERKRKEEEKRQKEEEKRQREEEKRRKEEERERQKKEREKERERERKERERQLEKERREREKQEKAEKARKEREKAEKERKAREAAAAKKNSVSPVSKSRSAPTVNNKTKTTNKSPSVKAQVTSSRSSPAKGRRGKATVEEEEDEEEEEEEEEEEMDTTEEVPPLVNSSGTKRRSGVSLFNSDDSDVIPAKKPRGSDREALYSSDAKTDDENDISQLSSNEAESDSEIGTHVEGLVNKKWYSGKVVKVNHKENKWKVKFDYNPKDKYDKWFSKAGPDIRLKSGESVPQSTAPPSPTEAPSSSTSGPASSSTNQAMEEIANGYRTCLRYFLPPEWIMDKESITTMSLAELANFPLDDFFDHYEKGLRKLVGNFQTEAAQRKSKLSSVRKLIAKLLKSINEEFDIDPEADGDQVDELLAACVKQAVQSPP